MRGSILVVVALLAGGCSCDRRPDEQAAATAAPAQPAPEQVFADTAAQASQAEAAELRATAMSEAASTTHAYIAALVAKDRDKADSFWVGGKPPPRPDDYAVRGIEDMSTLRIDNDLPRSLDQESPPRSVEVPVTLRVRKEGGGYEIKGWYRLRSKVTGDGWEITSASLRPTLD